MKLLSIECSHFRQHKDTTLTFQTGLTGIVGPNGAGKSTLVEAVVFALFGIKGVRGKAEGIVTRGSKRKRASVLLRFEHGGHVFVVERTISDAKLFIGGNSDPVVKGTTAVTERIQEILSLNLDEFTATYFTGQKGLEFLSGTRGATERAKFIIRMMGYDKLEQAQDLLRKERRDLRNKIGGLQAGLSDEKKLLDRIDSETKVLADLEKKLLIATNTVKSSLSDYNQVESKWKELDQAKINYESIEGKLEIVRERAKLLRESISSIEDKLSSKELVLNDYESQLKNWNGARELLEEELSEIITKVSALEKARTDSLKHWESSRIAAKVKVQAAELALQQEVDKQNKFSKLEGESDCPTCGQSLGSNHAMLLHSINESCAEARDKLSSLRLTHNEEIKEPNNLVEINEELSIIARQRKSLEEKRVVFDRLESLLIEVNELGEQLTKERTKFESTATEIKEFEKSVKASAYSPEEYVSYKAKYETARKLLEVNRLQRMRHESDVGKYKALLARSKDDLAQLKSQQADLATLKRELLLLDESDATFTSIRQSLNASVRPRLADLASEFIADLTDGRYSTVEIGEDFTPTVYEDGVPKPVISGGEEDVLNLCVRLALSQMVAERAGHAISLLLLDEVFGSLDENRRYNVLLLLDKLQNRFDQVLLITHLDDIKEGVQHFINVEYDEGTGVVSLDSVDSFDLLAMNV